MKKKVSNVKIYSISMLAAAVFAIVKTSRKKHKMKAAERRYTELPKEPVKEIEEFEPKSFEEVVQLKKCI